MDVHVCAVGDVFLLVRYGSINSSAMRVIVDSPTGAPITYVPDTAILSAPGHPCAPTSSSVLAIAGTSRPPSVRSATMTGPIRHA